MFLSLVFAKSSCVPGWDSSLAVLSPIDWVNPFPDAKLNALVFTQGNNLENAPVDYQ